MVKTKQMGSAKHIIFAMSYPDSVGGVWDGIIRFYDTLAKELQKHDFICYAAFPKISDEPIYKPENIRKIELDLIHFMGNLSKITRTLKEYKINLIVFVDILPRQIRFDVLKRLHVKTINFSRWGFAENEKPGLLKLKLKQMMKYLKVWDHDIYIPVSKTQQQCLIKWTGLPPNRVHLAANGIDVNRFTPGKPPKPSEYGLPEKQFYILMACNSRKEKHIDFLIDVAQKIYLLNLPICFVYAGDGLLRKAWEKKVFDLDLTHCFYFLGHIKNLVPLYRLADIFVHASSREASPRVLMEALASGLPVVASDIEPHKELINNETLGIIIKNKKINDYAEAILRLYKRKELRDTYSKTAVKYAKVNFDENKQVLTVKQIIVNLLAS